MEYRRLGKYGLRLSEISIGAWLTYGGSVEEEKSIECIHTALENGVNFIDNADVYSRGQAETVLGKALQGETYERRHLVISSKVFWPVSENIQDYGLSRKHIFDSIEGSLKRLQLEYLDIYYCHRFDYKTPLEETVAAMDDLVKDGRVRYWGTSVWTAAQLERVMGIVKEMGATPPSVEQPRYNMFDRQIELEVMDTTRYHGIGITPWSPLGQGLLTGKYNDGIPEDSRATRSEFLKKSLTEENISKVRKLTDLAATEDMTMSQLALAWILRRPEISSVITGATKPEQILNNIQASGKVLSKNLLEDIENILGNKPEFNPPYGPALADKV